MSSKNEFASISFDLPKNNSNVIKVIGVGGGGSNAINHMFQQGIKGVDFYICNTDAQALHNSGVPNKIQLGLNLTEGLGAGANPQVGEQSAVESFEDISNMLDSNTKLVFITAGMGGGTGTGAAPIIAKMAKDLGVLTVGIVTMPFQFEGKTRIEQAQIGIENLRNVCDSLIVINNNKLREIYGNLGFKAGFSKADEVLSTAARGIAEVITHHYTQNIDLRDAKTVLSNSGTAIMGSATASGKSRAQDAIRKALDSPLLNDNKITGAKNVLLLIVSGTHEITIDEIGEINDHIQTEAGHGANIIMGVGEDETLEESIAVTIIATGFDVEQQDEISNTEIKKVIHSLVSDEVDEHPIHKKLAAVAPVIKPTEKHEPTVIKHVLDFDMEDEIPVFEKKVAIESVVTKTTPINNIDLIPTSELLRNMNVIFEEVSAYVEETQDFIINPVSKTTREEKDVPVVFDNVEEEKQITLTFDLPIAHRKNGLEEDMKPSIKDEEAVKKIAINDYIELISVNETSEKGEIRYTLEDYNEAEKTTINKKQSEAKQLLEEFDQEIVFEKKIIHQPVKAEIVGNDLDPMNSPISEILIERAEERRRKMKDFNYKFNNAKIDDIEKVPAYKRQGINLDEARHSSETDLSRSSVSFDDNDDVKIRSNNSFLHDNVD